ncbi:MAG TPA: aromatic ring-hydroxylating dioxygenase subunit alpha, partial [Gaiellaceae bacterium]|nr:aromatic ring-hydroxylating dioxygenase subunit alpha [Gaiellaceae bacterium]
VYVNGGGGKMAPMNTTIPWDWYRDPAVLGREQEAIFRSAWHYVGRLREPGDVVPGWAGRVPVVLVKAEDGEERAFVNVCRHRGSIVVEDAGNRKTLQCGYHAWTYGLDGSLRAAPRSEREGVDLSDVSLVAVRLERWGPFRFVNLDDAAAPLAELLGDIPERVAGGGLDVDELVYHHRVDWEVAANWKIVCENFLECYHCPVAHPGFSGVVDVSPDNYELDAGHLRWSQFGQLRSRGDAELPVGQFHFLWPNTGINVFPGRPNLSIGPILPLAHDRTRRILDYFFAPDADEKWIAEFLEFDDQVGREDVRLVELVQKGAGSGVIPEGRLLPESERLVAGFQARVREALRA